jgi:glyoxylase-like metal-dependent hydrolase (beta-lactamase superfamily II)/rhodanese-related sulfurtransferase
MAVIHPSATLSTNELLSLLDDSPDVFLLDVREPDEFATWRIPRTVNIPLGEIEQRLSEVPRDAIVVTVCAKGARAERASEILRHLNYRSVVLEGGMEEWGHTYEVVNTNIGAATVSQIRRRGKGCLSYVVGSSRRLSTGATGNAVVIDPSVDVDVYLSVAKQHDYVITHVFDTHLHADHLSGARELARRTGAELVLNAADTFHYDFRPLTPDFRLALDKGRDVELVALSTPGHTEGSTAFLLNQGALFSGDTLFLESVGRPDLADQAEPFARTLFQTLHHGVLKLSDDVKIFPAHYGEAVDVHYGELITKTLGELRTSLTSLSMGEEEFVAWAVSHVKERPPNYANIVLFNSGESKLTLEEVTAMELGPNRCAVAS